MGAFVGGGGGQLWAVWQGHTRAQIKNLGTDPSALVEQAPLM